MITKRQTNMISGSHIIEESQETDNFISEFTQFQGKDYEYDDLSHLDCCSIEISDYY